MINRNKLNYRTTISCIGIHYLQVCTSTKVSNPFNTRPQQNELDSVLTAENADKQPTGKKNKKKKKKKVGATKLFTIKDNVTEVTATTKSLSTKEEKEISMTTVEEENRSKMKKRLEAVQKLTAATIKVDVLVAAAAKASKEVAKARKEVEALHADTATDG